MKYKKGDKIKDDETLLRRVYRSDKRYIDKNTGRPTSRAFAPRPKDEGKLSVDIERLTSYEKAILDSKKFVLFSIISKTPHNLGLECIYDPLIGEKSNIAHTLIVGFKNDDESIPGILSRKCKRVSVP